MMDFLISLLPIKNPQRAAVDQLRQCQLEKLEAEAAKEHWDQRVIALKNREKRLLAQVASDARTAESQRAGDSYTIA